MSLRALVKIAESSKPHPWQTVTTGDPGTRFLADIVGKVNPLTLLTSISDPRIYHNMIDTPFCVPRTLKETSKNPKARLVSKLLKKMQAGSDGQLDDVAIRVGGTDPWSDIKRALTNPRTSFMGKALGTAAAPLLLPLNLSRGSHYNPFSHSLTIYSDNPAVLTHELGHAIDMNVGKRPEIHNVRDAVWNELRNIPSDVYRTFPVAINKIPTLIWNNIPASAALAYPYKLYIEGQANRKGYKAIEKAFTPEETKLISDIRNKSLISAYGSYVGSAAPTIPVVYPISINPGSVAGMVAGRLGGELYAKDKRGIEDLTNDLIAEFDAEKDPKKKPAKKTVPNRRPVLAPT